MVKIKQKKAKQFRIISDSVNMGLSGNKIQKLLRANDIGMRNKKLYEEIRKIKGESINKEKREKSIPKKYRKKEGMGGLRPQKIGYIYRGSLIISSLPFHSRFGDRHYIGFRLSILSFDKKTVSDALKSMKKEFIKMVGDFLKSDAYAKEQTLGIEYTTKITLSNPERFNNKWFFAVEDKGRDIYSRDGYI